MSFAYHPELFEQRSVAIETLSEHGFTWLTDFSAVDLLHELYGLEVCGIPARTDAIKMRKILRDTFPDWEYTNLWLKDYGDRDLGWKLIIHRDEEDLDTENWSQV